MSEAARDQPSGAAAVIVAHNPDEGFLERVVATGSQAASVVIVDNASDADHIGNVVQAAAAAHAHTILNRVNYGQATALNQGMAYASSRGFDWVVTLDQDTIPKSDLLERLWAVLDAYPQPHLVGAIASNGVDRFGRQIVRCSGEGSPWKQIQTAITSGMLIRLSAFREAGPFCDDLFIDLVDFEWCLRLSSTRYVLLAPCQVTMRHDIGKPKQHRFLFKRVIVYHHSPVRQYYATRNSIWVWRRYYRSHPVFVLKDAKRLAVVLLKTALYERNRLARLRMITLGALHGIAGRLGPFPGSL